MKFKPILYNNNFFIFKTPSSFEIIISIIYFLIILTVIFLGFFNKTNLAIDFIGFYSFGLPLFMYLFCYKALRNFYIYLLWFIFSIINLIIYFYFKEIPELYSPINNYFIPLGLKYFWVFLIFFQVLRFISLTFRNKEFVAPSKYSRYDIFDKRKIESLDYIFFTIFAFLWIIGYIYFP